jgi:Helix-turn-helix
MVMNKPLDSKTILGINLRMLMLHNKHSQGFVHKETGISQSTVGRILYAKVSATTDSIDSIAKLYGLLSWQLLVCNLDIQNLPTLTIPKN